MAKDIALEIIDLAKELEKSQKQIQLQLLSVHYDFEQNKYIDDVYILNLENIDEHRIKISYKSLFWIQYKKSKETADLVIFILRQKITQILRKNKIPSLNEHRLDVSIIHKGECIFTESMTIMTPIEYEDLSLVHKYDCNNNLALKDLQILYLTYFKLAANSIRHQTTDS
jgi:hypothetical protein